MIKRRNYTFALTKDNDRIIKIVEKYPKYAYIKHDKDNAEIHYHYYIEFPNPRSINSVATELSIPDNMLEQVYSKKGILAYLTHENSPDKHHYDTSEIISNFDVILEGKEDDRKISHEDYILIATAINDYGDGKISFMELVNIMEPLLCSYNAARIFDLFLKAKNRNVRACHTFRVPCSTTSITGTKKGGKMT